MPDNPAVRAVAAVVRERRTSTMGSERITREALAALASSQEVRTWLLSKFEKDHAWQPTEYDPCWSLRPVLDALGGGQ